METQYKWLPALYATYYGILVEVAKEHGYALGLHGTLTRDFDIIAVPWTQEASSHLDLLKAINNIIGIDRRSEKPFDSTEIKPHGRVSYTLQCGGGGYFDISIMPLVGVDDAK